MFRTFLILIVIIHGFIHLMGFAKAFQFGAFPQLTRDISRPAGLAWLATGIMLLFCAILMLWKKEWWALGMAAVAVSQLLIFSVWSDAKFGTLANFIILLAAITVWGASRFEGVFRRDIRNALAAETPGTPEQVTEADLQALPAPVQRYLRNTGVVGKPKPKHARIVFEGEMRKKGGDWFPFVSEQYNFFERPTRLFFMKGRMFGTDVPGYHAYKNGTATMEVKLFGLIPVADNRGDVMNKTETVTVFNDLCLMVPAALLDKRIAWESIDDRSVRARFTCNGISISATLFFNENGDLINFISDDRTEVNSMQQLRFSTPVGEYRDYNGYRLASQGEGVYRYPDGEFTYGKFHLKSVEYDAP